MASKERLDELLVLKKLAPDIKQARALIVAGKVLVNEQCSDKAGNLHDSSAEIRLKGLNKYVSRGGLKLEKALSHFDLDIAGIICADIGASTGGFTDCLLQNGAAKVYAIDVAYGQLAWKLRQDSRVVVLERFNARKISKSDIPTPLDLVVIDASFISLKSLIPPLLPLLSSEKNIIALIKPQFELPRQDIEKGGVVTNANLHAKAQDIIMDFAKQSALSIGGITESPVLGPKGNKEFLVHLLADIN